MSRVVLYTAPRCPYCAKLKGDLRSCAVPFEERSVEDPKVAKELFSQGIRDVPAIAVDGKLTVGYNAEWVKRNLCGR